MATNKITIVLDAKDLASDKINKLLGGINNQLGNVGNQTRSGAFQGQLMGMAFDKAFALAVGGAKAFMNALENADVVVQDAIKASAGLAAGAGISFGEAEKLNKTVTTAMEKSAAALPGVTSEFIQFGNMISDSVAESSKSMNGGVFNAEKYAKSLTDITEAAMVLKGKNFSTANTAKAIEKMTSGASISALKRYSFFQQNPAILTAYEKALRGRDTKTMSKGELLKATTEALQRAMPPEALAKMKGTIDAQVQNFMTKLFGTYEGIFSLNRDTDKIKAGDQTGQASIAKFAEAVFGDGGLTDSLGKLLSRLGLSADPVKMLVQGVDNLTLFVKDFTKFTDKLANTKGLDIAGLFDAGYAKVDQFMKNINWEAVGFQLGRFLTHASIQLIKIAAMTPFKQAAIARSIAFGLLKGLGSALVGIAYQMVENIMNGIFDAILSIPKKIGQVLINLINGVTSTIQSLLWIVQNPKQAIFAAIGKIGNAIESAVNGLVGGFIGLIKWVLGRTMSQMTLGLSDTNIGKAIGGAVLGGTVNKGLEVRGEALKATGGWNPFGWLSGLFGGNKAGGWMPPGSPLAREMAAMPGGAKPVVANSSEAILNQGQQSAMAGLIRGNRGGGGTFAPVITIQGNADRGDIDYLLGELDRRYRQYSAGFA
jgi:hypothetical protein